MADELLPYYNRELAFIRRLSGEFARANPKIAARLRLSEDLVEDPHTERLIEAFAYLTARVRHKLEDDFPEITDALLGVLYPHYLLPVPSMAIVQFALDRTQGELTTGYTIARDSMIETEPIDGEPCRFRACYPVTLWPVEVVSASLSGRPFAAPATRYSSEATAVLRIALQCVSKDLRFSQLALQSLRFFLKGQSQHVSALYELLFNNVLEVAIAASPRDPEPVSLSKQCVREVGFERDQGALPYSARSFLGYRLLSEYFAFPEKFHFFEIGGLNRKILSQAGNSIELFLYLNRTAADLEGNVTADTFRLGCTPIVNLFGQRADPIQLTHTQNEYRVVPDARRPMATEVYSIDRVTATSPDGDQIEFLPFYSFRHASRREAQRTFWYASRRPAERSDGEVDQGTEVFLTLVDLGFKPLSPADWTLDLETTCLNRDLPNRLPFGGGQPHMLLSQGAPIARIECLTPPTATFRPALKRGALWRAISHLSLNHLSISDNADGAAALREILKLYDFRDSDETRAMIDGIVAVQSRRVVGRVPGSGSGSFCRGVEVKVEFDEERFSGGGLYLFACMLERFLALYCSVNSFSKMIATTKQREGELRRWAPRAGEKVLL